MASDDEPATDEILKGLALLAVAQVDAGTSTNELIRLLWPLVARYGLDSADGVRRVALAVSEAPEPPHGAGDWWLATHEVTRSLADLAEKLQPGRHGAGPLDT